MSLVKKVQNIIFQHNLFEKGDIIILGVSGGSDSVAMLDIFSRLKKKYDLKLLIAHVNYRLRGKDSDADEELVRKLAGKYELVCKVHRVSKVHKVKKHSEDNLRDIRYDFFEKVRLENKADLIAVAHNADDQVETYLMRIIRGTGLKGLRAMGFKNGKVIRPLLSTPRVEIEKYLKEKKLKGRLDKTNLESNFLRNKIRNKLIPFLEKEYNSNLKKTILGSIGSIAHDYDFISSFAEKSSSVFLKNFSIQKFLTLHPALQRRVLRQIISQKKADLEGVSAAHINEILKIIKSTKNKGQVMKFQGLKIFRRGDKLIIARME